MQVTLWQSPAWQMPSVPQVSPAGQSLGWPQYTGIAPPVPLVVDVELDVDGPPPVPPLPPVPVVVEPSGTQLAVGGSVATWQVKPALHPQRVQSPLWHWPSCPQTWFS